MKVRFYAGVVDSLGIDIFQPLDLRTPIEMFKIRCNANMHRKAKWYVCMVDDVVEEEILKFFSEGKYKKAKKILYEKALYLTTRCNATDRMNRARFVKEGVELMGKLKMLEAL